MAVEYTFRVGDPVWGKVKGFSAWPGKIVLPPDGLKVIIFQGVISAGFLGGGLRFYRLL
jgi:hypothetical protein